MTVKTKPELATFWQRLMAFMLDLFIIIIPVFSITLEILSRILFDEAAIKGAKSPDFELIYQLHKNLIFIMLAGIGASGLVSSLFVVSRWQASPGKRLAGIYIASADGAKPSMATALGRFVSLPLFILLLQVFERDAAYKKIDEIRASGKYITEIADLQAQIATPASQVTGLVVFIAVGFWFLRIFFRQDKAAFHDTLFNTRVYQGRK